MLQDWQLEIAVEGDLEQWNDLAERFRTRILTILEDKDGVRQQAAALLLRDIGSATASPGRTRLASQVLTPLTPALAKVAAEEKNDATVRIAAAQALGKLNPALVIAKPVKATPPDILNPINAAILDEQEKSREEARKRFEPAAAALQSLLTAENAVDIRRKAIRCVADLIQSVTQQDPVGTGELRTMNDRVYYFAEQRLAQVAMTSFADADPEVRATAVQAVGSLAKLESDNLQGGSPVTRDYLPNVTLKQDEAKKLRDAQDQLRTKITQQFREFYGMLGAAAGSKNDGNKKSLSDLVLDSNPKVQTNALYALRDVALLYQRVRPQTRTKRPGSDESNQVDGRSRRVDVVALDADESDKSPFDPLDEGLRHATGSLIKVLASSSDAKVRLTAVEDIELLGPAIAAYSATVGDAVVLALRDSDRFVRWAAARAIGKLGFVSPAKAVGPLAAMLLDSDFDLQMVAISTLATYGPDAGDAVPNLVRAVERGDSDVRANAMRTLAIIGTDTQPAVAASIRALTDDKPATRKQAADLLGRFGAKAKAAVPALKSATEDADPDVRRAAAQAILNITRP